jgi:hypothetical protein
MALYLLSAGALLLSLLWWPGLAEAIGRRLGFVLPAGKPWEVLLSWLLVGLGVLGGAVAVRQDWGNEDEVNARHPMLSRWFGLPALATRGASALFAASHALARFDDRVVDGGLRLVARYGSAAHALARFDDRAVDGGVRLTARVGEGLARLGDRRGEALFDGWVSGLSEATGALGRHVRRLQSGQMHHYYTGIAAGLAVVVLILAIGGLP